MIVIGLGLGLGFRFLGFRVRVTKLIPPKPSLFFERMNQDGFGHNYKNNFLLTECYLNDDLILNQNRYKLLLLIF